LKKEPELDAKQKTSKIPMEIMGVNPRQSAGYDENKNLIQNHNSE